MGPDRRSTDHTDAKMLHQLESWDSPPSHGASSRALQKGCTAYLPLIESFQDRVAAATKRVAVLHKEKDPLSNSYKRRLKENWVDSLCFLFDGLLTVATAPDEAPDGRRASRVAIVKNKSKAIVSRGVGFRVAAVRMMCFTNLDRKHDYSSRSSTLNN